MAEWGNPDPDVNGDASRPTQGEPPMRVDRGRPTTRTLQKLLTISAVTGVLVAAGAAAPALAARPQSAVSPRSPVLAGAVRPGYLASAIQKVVANDTTIGSAQSVTTPNTHTPYCRVDGFITTSGP